MYRILLSTGGRAYASDMGDNCMDDPKEFTDNVADSVEGGDIIVLADDLEEAREKLDEWEIIDVSN